MRNSRFSRLVVNRRECRSPRVPRPASCLPQAGKSPNSIEIFVYLYRSLSTIVDSAELQSQTSSTPTKVSLVEPKQDLPWLQDSPTSRGFWNDIANQRLYVNWLGEKLDFRTRDAWYKVTTEEFARNKGHGLLAKYERSVYRLLSAVYTDYEYLPWLFPKTTSTFYAKRENRQKYVDWLVSRVGVKSYAELKSKHFTENSGWGLLSLYAKSPHNVIDSLRGDDTDPIAEDVYARECKPKRYWAGSIENQRAFIDSLGKELGIQPGEFEKWYAVEQRTLIRLGASGLLKLYNNTVSRMLKTIYPEYEWISWKFSRLPKHAGRDIKQLQSAIEYMEKQLGITDPSQWYRISKARLVPLNTAAIIRMHGGLARSLKLVRPEVAWDETKFVRA